MKRGRPVRVRERGHLVARDYGFRVFIVEMFENQQKGKDPVPLHVGSEARDELLDLIERAASLGTTFLDSKQPDNAGEPAIPKVSITVTGPQYVTDSIVHFEVSTGEVGGHRHAVTEDGSQQSLEDASAERGFFGTFCFPRVEGGTPACLLVLETHKSSDVKRRLFPFLNRLSRELKKEAVDAERQERKAAREAGEELKPRGKFVKYLFDVRQIADSDYFNRLLQEAKSATAVFTESVPSSSGGLGSEVQKTLTFSLRTDEQKRGAGVVGRLWHGRTQSGSDGSHPDAISELAAAVNLNEEEVSDYDEVCIRIRSKNGESVTVRPHQARDMFTYQISDGQPSVIYYYMKVAPKVAELAQGVGLDVDEIDVAEVKECLIDSTSAQSSEG